MTERLIDLPGPRGQIALPEAEGIPRCAQADEARALLAGTIEPQPGAQVLDLWCGTGLCALAAARAQPEAQVTAADVSYHLCRLAQDNARRNRLANVSVAHSDGFDHLPTTGFDDIYFSPPTHSSATTVRKLIAQAALRLRPGGRLYLAVRTRQGGRAHRRWVETHVGTGERVARAGGAEIWLYAARPEWRASLPQVAEALARQEERSLSVVLRGVGLVFGTKVNVFSWEVIDAGTALLIEALPEAQPSRVLDLGCGYGPIGIVAARMWPEAEVAMVDVDRRALALATANAAANGCSNAEVMAGEGVPEPMDAAYHLILSNLPTHIGVGAMEALLRQAHGALCRRGALLAVISRELRVDTAAQAIFGNVATVAESETHRVFHCRKTS